MKKLLESLEECGMAPMGAPAPMDRGTPVSMNVSLNASGKEHVEDLINMMKNAGMSAASQVKPDMMPAMSMRHDMDKFRDIVDGPKMALPAPEEMDMEDDVEEEGYDNEPDEQYGSVDDVIPSGDDLHKAKKSYPKANGGDNPMALEQEILRALKAEYAAKK